MKSYNELKALIDQRGTHAVFGELGDGWAIEQNSAELAEFLVQMQELGVESVLEIGTGWKGGLSRFLAADDGMAWQTWSMDIEQHSFIYEHVTYMRGADNVRDYAANTQRTWDLVFIDADHSYEGVKNDHQLWGKYATKVIAFHDIAGLRDCEGVKQYWDEIAHQREATPHGDIIVWKSGYHEIIADGDQRGGIGYIVLSEVQEQPEAPVEEVVEAKVEAKKPAPKPTPRKRTPASKATAGKKPVAKTARK